MKKLTALLLAAGLVLSLVGCGTKEEAAPAEETAEAAAEETEAPAEAAAEEAPAEE